MGTGERVVLIAVAADKGAPGVTTACLALALAWPRPVLLAECDPAGADLPWWVGGQDGRPLVQTTGLVSLATSSRGLAGGHRQVWDHVQRLDGGLPVLVGPAGPEQAEAMGGTWTTIASLLAGLDDADVVADCGRVLTRASPVAPVLQHADLVVLVTRPTVSGVAHLRHGITTAAQIVNDAGGRGSGLDRVAVLVVDDPITPGSRKASHRQVDEVLDQAPGLRGVPVLAVLAHDPKAAAALAGDTGAAARRLDRSMLLRTAPAAAAGVFERADQLAAAAQVLS